ncbi:unnamed protein product [Rangifer tarandus platyrhynchus]|uniref:Uncharacterized protein n=1 Tax=Rangifer tarandus platyrhynchus TaxID=3082113 RepID=A0ABN8XNV9_RANTA|nr:unnamed protein product [Rangifer tarandus platyrhynchus]CAI9689738.1 unnamed protein product [Rangifer tarandus platyrhynchus]
MVAPATPAPAPTGTNAAPERAGLDCAARRDSRRGAGCPMTTACSGAAAALSARPRRQRSPPTPDGVVRPRVSLSHRPARPGNGARGPAKDPARGEDAPLTFSEKFGSPDAPVARGARGRETTPARLRDALPHANLGDELSREERRLREAARAGASPPAFAPRDQTRGSRAARQPRSCCRQTKFKKNTPTVPSTLDRQDPPVYQRATQDGSVAAGTLRLQDVKPPKRRWEDIA